MAQTVPYEHVSKQDSFHADMLIQDVGSLLVRLLQVGPGTGYLVQMGLERVIICSRLAKTLVLVLVDFSIARCSNLIGWN